jgi:hypothetical protein
VIALAICLAVACLLATAILLAGILTRRRGPQICPRCRKRAVEATAMNGEPVCLECAYDEHS